MGIHSCFTLRATRWLAALLLTTSAGLGSAAETVRQAGPDGVVVGSASITYFARSGDTLMSIARQFTDRVGNWQALGKLNRINQDSAIPIGTAILIPAELLGDTPARATVVAVTGTVSATLGTAAPTRLALGATVLEGTRIDTAGNSFLTLALADQSRISIPSNSRVRIATLRTTRYLNSPRTQVMLLRGRVESRVTPLEASRGRYEVRTPLSVAGVRGTHFRVGLPSAAQVATETLEGKVAVATVRDAGAPDGLVLGRGLGDIIGAQGVGPAIDLLPAPRLVAEDSTARAEFPADRIAIAGVAGARGYHLQLATDPEAQNLVAESRSQSNTVAIDGVPDGDYYTVLTAIDRFGLEGFASTQPISLRASATARAATPAAPGAPTVAASDDKSMSLRWKPVAGASMRLQLARDSDFSFLLANRISSSGEARLPRPPFGTYYARVELLDANGNPRVSSLAQPLIVTDQWIMNDGLPVAVRQSRAALR